MAAELLCIAIGGLMGWSFGLFFCAHHGAEDAVFVVVGVLGAQAGRAVWSPELTGLLGWRAWGLPPDAEQLLLAAVCAALLLLLSRTFVAAAPARRGSQGREAGSPQRVVR